MEDALDRLLPRIGGSGVIDRLAALSGSDFTSVMLEVARRRAARENPASVLRRYERDRFVRPGQGPVRALRRVENVLLGCLPEAERRVVQLTVMYELPQRAVAQRLGVSQMQVSRLRASGLRRLRQQAGDLATLA